MTETLLISGPWLLSALLCFAGALGIRYYTKRLASAALAIQAYRAALVVERAARKRKAGVGFDWRDSHLQTRVADDRAMTRVWRQS